MTPPQSILRSRFGGIVEVDRDHPQTWFFDRTGAANGLEVDRHRLNNSVRVQIARMLYQRQIRDDVCTENEKASMGAELEDDALLLGCIERRVPSPSIPEL